MMENIFMEVWKGQRHASAAREIQPRRGNIPEAGPLPQESDGGFSCFLFFGFFCRFFSYFTAFVVPGKCQREICLPSQYALGADGTHSFHLKMDAICLQPAQFAALGHPTTFYLCVMFRLAYVPFVPLHSLNAAAHS